MHGISEDSSRAKELIARIHYITIATALKNGIPWNSPVFAAYDENYNFYWRSGKEAQHSKNISENENIFIVVFDSSREWGNGEGVYIQARAHQLTKEKEVSTALSLLDKRSGTTMGKSDKFSGDFPRRVYKAIPQKVWMNKDGEVNGSFVDTRVEINLLRE